MGLWFPARTLTIGAVFAACLATGVQAQTYPNRPVRMIAPFPAGGLADVLARLVGDELSKTLGQPVIVDNRGSAAGIVGLGVALVSLAVLLGWAADLHLLKSVFLPWRGPLKANTALALLLAGTCAALAAVAGVCLSLSFTLAPSQIYAWIGVVFAAVMMGGLGSALGPLVAGVVIGVSEALTMAITAPSWAPIVSFTLLIALLLLKP